MIPSALLKYFDKYPQIDAPFMHQQLFEWTETQPLAGLRVLHHVPVVPNTLLKITCLIAAGADVTVTNPSSFCQAHAEAVTCLNESGIRYINNLNSLINEKFDLYFDCGAELYQVLGKPNLGAIELTGSGDQFYRQQNLDFPVISIDPTLTKQLETVFGCAESAHLAIAKLTGINIAGKSWLIFGFGKIGRGLAYYCMQQHISVAVVDVCEYQRESAEKLGIKAINPNNLNGLETAIAETDIIITATGKKAVMEDYPYKWFGGKILANLGVYDEYGPQFSEMDILNQKKPINFVLHDPTPMKYIDPEFYLHNVVALSFLQNKLNNGMHKVSEEMDEQTINSWCKYHSFSLGIINKWFIRAR